MSDSAAPSVAPPGAPPREERGTLLGRAGGVFSGGMAVALGSVVLVASLGALAFFGLRPARAPLDGVWAVGGGAALCLREGSGGTLAGTVARGGAHWKVEGTRAGEAVRGTLRAGEAVVGDLEGALAAGAGGAVQLGGVVRLHDAAAGTDLVLRFAPASGAPVAPEGCL